LPLLLEGGEKRERGGEGAEEGRGDRKRREGGRGKKEKGKRKRKRREREQKKFGFASFIIHTTHTDIQYALCTISRRSGKLCKADI
jgi:hypothetical protein